MTSPLGANVKWFVLGAGLWQFPTAEIVPGMKIKQVLNLNVFELAKLGTRGFVPWALLEPYCRNGWPLFEVESDATELEGFDSLNRVWLFGTLLVVRGYYHTHHLAYLTETWQPPLPSVSVGPFHGELADYRARNHFPAIIAKTDLEDDDLQWISKNFDFANTLAAKQKKFDFLLKVMTQWRYATDLRMAMALVWGGIESIFEIEGEISYRLSLTISSVLEPRGNSRKELFGKIKKLYTWRSKIVHGSKFDEGKAVPALEDSVKLLGRLIDHMIRNKKFMDKAEMETAIFD